MNHGRKSDDWMQKVHESQRNTVFPDTARNFGGFWGGLYRQKLNAVQSVGLLILVVFYILFFVGVTTLVSLWYGRNASERATEVKETPTDNYFSWMTAMMRINKESTNDFICAKKSVKPFCPKGVDDNISTAAKFLALIYDPFPRPVRPKIGLVPQGPLSSFKTALELARSFPVGVHGSQVCPYCYNTGDSSPGTRCSYCQMGKR
jgi:hypothetical protein